MKVVKVGNGSSHVPVSPIRKPVRSRHRPSFNPILGNLTRCLGHVLGARGSSKKEVACIASERDDEHLPTDAVMKNVGIQAEFPRRLADDSDTPIRAVAEPVASGIGVMTTDEDVLEFQEGLIVDMEMAIPLRIPSRHPIMLNVREKSNPS